MRITIKKPRWQTATLAFLSLTTAIGVSQAALTDGLIAYWPLDEVTGAGDRTPDISGSGYDMELVNLSADDLVEGKVGSAFFFEAGRQTLLQYIAQEGDKIPANDQHDAWSVALWVKGKGTGQNDLRVFSEGSTENSNPLFNIGTANNGSNDQIDIFIRGNTGQVTHPHSTQDAFDDSWHLITWTQTGNTVALYVDGVLDGIEIAEGVTPLIAEENTYIMNTTTIGGIRRATASHWWTGAIDDVAMWDRALAPDEVAALANGELPAAFEEDPISDGMISLWRLDEVSGSRTPDAGERYDMELVNLTEADLVEGKYGQAFFFEAGRQTLLQYIAQEGDLLPANEQHDAWSVSLWVKGKGTGQNDLRVFSEGSTENSNPLFNIGTANNGSNDSVDIFIRGNTGQVTHPHSTQAAFDDEWRLITWTQSGNEVALYIDGQLDGIEIAEGVTPLIADENTYVMNTTTIGGIRRATASHWWTGAIDEVAMWNRALSGDEVARVFSGGPLPPPRTNAELVIRSFDSERPKVAKGDSSILEWEVKGIDDSTRYIIQPGDVDVTDQTLDGFGRAEIPVTAATTYSLEVIRDSDGAEASAEHFVEVRDGVGPGWTLLDDFSTWEPGPILTATEGSWFEPDSNSIRLIPEGDDNVIGVGAGNALSFTELDSFQIRDSESRTVFFRFKMQDDGSGIFANLGITNKAIRFVGDVNGGLGGFVGIRREEGDQVGEIGIGPIDNNQGLDYELQSDTWYKVWLDITNSPGDSTDTISVHIQGEGDASRTTLAEDAQGDRGNVVNHIYFFLAPREGTTGEDAFLVDDVFVATDGILESDPLDTDDPNLAMKTRGIFADVSSSTEPVTKEEPIFNIGATNTLNISSATITGADAGLFTLNSFPSSLEPGADGIVSITFTPAGRTGGVLAFLELESNDQSNPVVTVDLSTVVPSTNGLIGHYRMDETDGDTMLDAALLKHGSYVQVGGGTFELGEPALASGTAVAFSSAGQADGGYAQARPSAGLLTAFSISMWVESEGPFEPFATLFAKGEQGGSPGFAALYNGDSILWFTEDSDPEGPGALPSGKLHVVFSYVGEGDPSGATPHLDIFVNGENVYSLDNPPPAVDNTSLPVR